ncbi:hypothetical protein [Saccharothrix deserti]|uniref:hypothetical protein n=1 Tax=Saccharothrix deserti TaxID=2593674 RepID=UPI00192E6440|nr:hypothetical protein [Saccharothrix deserti]
MPSSTPGTRQNTLQAALDYAAFGWPVVPGAVWHDGGFADPADEQPVADPCLRPVEAATTDAALVHELAADEAPRLFAIVEEYGEREGARVAGYGVAFEDRAEVDSVEGGFHLSSESAERARTLFEISSRSTGTRRAHLVWPDETTTVARQD